MRFDVTTLGKLYDTLVKAHLPPSACEHPKAQLRICTWCGIVHCAGCHSVECPGIKRCV